MRGGATIIERATDVLHYTLVHNYLVLGYKNNNSGYAWKLPGLIQHQNQYHYNEGNITQNLDWTHLCGARCARPIMVSTIPPVGFVRRLHIHYNPASTEGAEKAKREEGVGTSHFTQRVQQGEYHHLLQDVHLSDLESHSDMWECQRSGLTACLAK